MEHIQYFHRAAGCQIISSPVKSFLGVEWVAPGEGEDKAALRLLTRLVDLYGSRFFDILLLDSLYAQAPVLKTGPGRGLGSGHYAETRKPRPLSERSGTVLETRSR